MLRNSARYLIPTARQYLTGRGTLVDAQLCRTFFRRHCYPPFVELESRMREMDRYVDRVEKQMNSEFGSPFHQRGRFPFSNDRFFHFPTLESKVEAAENGNPGKYSLTVDLGKQFSPEDIKISLKDRTLTIEAKFEIKTEGENSSRIYQEVSRQFTLPQGINPEDIKSFVSPGGILSIEVPLLEVETPKPKEIPISIQQQN